MEVNTTTTTDPVNYYNKFNNFILNPIVFIIIILVIVAYFAFSSSLGNSENSGFNSITGNDSGGKFMGIIIVAILVKNTITINYNGASRGEGIQNIRTHIGTIRPDNSSQVRTNSNLPKIIILLQFCKNASIALNNLIHIDDCLQPISEG